MMYFCWNICNIFLCDRKFTVYYYASFLSHPFHNVTYQYGLCLITNFQFLHSLSHAQCLFLLDMKVKYVYGFLDKLLHWMEIGLYDFSSYPLTMKAYLDVESLNVFQPLRRQFKSTYSILLPLDSSMHIMYNLKESNFV